MASAGSGSLRLTMRVWNGRVCLHLSRSTPSSKPFVVTIYPVELKFCEDRPFGPCKFNLAVGPNGASANIIWQLGPSGAPATPPSVLRKEPRATPSDVDAAKGDWQTSCEAEDQNYAATSPQVTYQQENLLGCGVVPSSGGSENFTTTSYPGGVECYGVNKASQRVFQRSPHPWDPVSTLRLCSGPGVASSIPLGDHLAGHSCYQDRKPSDVGGCLKQTNKQTSQR